jgi:hypothetical protein
MLAGLHPPMFASRPRTLSALFRKRLIDGSRILIGTTYPFKINVSVVAPCRLLVLLGHKMLTVFTFP